ncbi:MAG: adenylyl-sulfate kinase [Alphaproteobacteria bacterium]|uniref:Adenylyl-sulfate kinase n=1 Tax=Candidatus Nitrobium versatile TaxID=2884831 RepID=A0A953LVR3_9BACT|nr:adenylyl-sulfate kinase [Candidatus Nitrobium versatile]
MTCLPNVVWHNGLITKKDRWALNKHKSALIWITGLSASGKSTIAHELESLLYEKGIRSYVLDGDNVRHGLNRNLGFSADDRKENLRRVGEVAKLFVDAGILTIASFISPYESDRNMIRTLFHEGEFIEVYLDCEMVICESRDPKGLYEKARKGEIEHFTGISDPYEIPANPEIVVNTGVLNVYESVEKIHSYMKSNGII